MSAERRAIYAGSFDPATNGHLDIINRAAALFDELIVAVATTAQSGGRPKRPLFTLQERMQMLEACLSELPNIRIVPLDGLLVHLAAAHGVSLIVKGLRAVSDFEAELQMALINRMLCPGVETVFLMTSPEYLYLSSSVVKEIAELGGSVAGFVPPPVERKLREKYTREGRGQP